MSVEKPGQNTEYQAEIQELTSREAASLDAASMLYKDILTQSQYTGELFKLGNIAEEHADEIVKNLEGLSPKEGSSVLFRNLGIMDQAAVAAGHPSAFNVETKEGSARVIKMNDLLAKVYSKTSWGMSEVISAAPAFPKKTTHAPKKIQRIADLLSAPLQPQEAPLFEQAKTLFANQKLDTLHADAKPKKGIRPEPQRQNQEKTSATEAYVDRKRPLIELAKELEPEDLAVVLRLQEELRAATPMQEVVKPKVRKRRAVVRSGENKKTSQSIVDQVARTAGTEKYIDSILKETPLERQKRLAARKIAEQQKRERALDGLRAEGAKPKPQALVSERGSEPRDTAFVEPGQDQFERVVGSEQSPSVPGQEFWNEDATVPASGEQPVPNVQDFEIARTEQTSVSPAPEKRFGKKVGDYFRSLFGREK